MNRPGPRLLGSGGEKSLQAEGRETDARELGQSGLLLAKGLEEFQRVSAGSRPASSASTFAQRITHGAGATEASSSRRRASSPSVDSSTLKT